MSPLSRLNRPWLHFVLLGAALYYLQGVLFPPPRPVVGPLEPARAESLAQQWLAGTGRPPAPEQLARMVAAELDRDILFHRAIALELHRHDPVVRQRLLRNMRFLQLAEGRSDDELYRQALEMRLHLGDEVVKRRLVQVMEQLMLAANPPAPVTEAQLAAEFELRREELRLPPRYSITHLYFPRDREAEIDGIMERIRAQALPPEQALALSSPFLPGYRFTDQSPDQLARHFGPAFVLNLQQSRPQPGQWVGPVRSTYGLHFVWIDAVSPARDASLEEVRARLERDLAYRARAAALEESIAALREQYEVRI